MVVRFFLVGIAVFAMTSVAYGDINLADNAKMEAFKKSHPEARFQGAQYFEGEGFFEQNQPVNYIFGTALSTGVTAQQSARDFCQDIEGIYATEVGELTARKWPSGNVLQGVMWNPETETHGFYTFRFEQHVDGVPVFRSGIGFLVRNEDGFPLVMSGNNLKEMRDFETVNLRGLPVVVTDLMKQNAAAEMANSNLQFDGSQSVIANLRQRGLPVEISEKQLVIWAGNTNVIEKNPEAAIQFIATQGSPSDFASYRKHLIVAAVDDGEILYSETMIHADVNGTVSGRGTDGVAAAECEDVAIFALPYAEVSITGGETVFADENGNFNIPSSANGNVTVNSRLEGLYFDLFDLSVGGSNSTPVISINVADPGSVDFLHNETNTAFSVANVNDYLHSNIVRDFVLNIEPTFPTIANQTGFNINTNINDDCNAFYDGSSINFFRNAGGCNSTSFADVVYHEYGHHLVNVTGNAQGQFGEGCSDTMAILLEDNPDLALGFFAGSCGAPLRSAENFRTYPCSGGIHDCGQLISGCVWDTINEIRAIDPDNAVDIVSRLFVSMLPVRGAMGGSSMIGPEITLIFLELDDDDGIVGNGTPHYQQIADAFNAHNMMAPELDLISLSFPNGIPTTIDPTGDSFIVDVEPVTGTQIPDSGILNYDIGNGFVQVPMTVVDADSYEAVFPAIDCGIRVRFFVSVEANNGDTVTLPAETPATSFAAMTATSLDTVVSESFDTDPNWTVSGNATDGQWERGIPNNGDRGDPAEDAEVTGGSFCFVTDNGNSETTNNTDVDGGSTILTTAVFDGVPDADRVPLISYYRWYSNDVAGTVNADTFDIEISNNGGSTWIELETVGPTGPDVSGGWVFRQFIIDDVITPTDNMRVRFIASDVGGVSIIEAGIDAFSVTMLECDTGCLPGDGNLDGTIDLLDVQPFVTALADGIFSCEADVNQDGVVDLLDVQPFIALLGG